MNSNRLLTLAGVLQVVFVVFHAFFPQIFDWNEVMAPLSAEDHDIMYIFNYAATYLLGLLAFVTLRYRAALTTTEMGKTLSIAIAGFWFWRVILEVIYFGLVDGLAVIISCSLVGALMLLPLFLTRPMQPKPAKS